MASFTQKYRDASGNTQASVLMTIGMGAYVTNDTLVRLAVDDLPLYEAVALRGITITVLVGLWLRITEVSLELAIFRHPAMIVRIVSEVGLTIVYLNTLLHLELANITAIMQVMPLTVTFAAAMFLGETVGWRRYVAIGIGFIGVLIIVRPTSDGFSGWSALVLVAVLLLTIRDLATRWLPTEIPSLVIAWTTAVSITAMGLVLSVGQGWETPTARPVALLVVAALCLVVGYFTGVQTVRIGDIAASAPFRYTVLIWGILLGYFVFDESPDAPTLIGAAVIVGASLYSLHRERVVKRRAATASGSTLLGNHTD